MNALPMKLRDAIYGRRSIRNYTDVAVSRELLLTLLDAAVQAPSAVNQQPWAFAVIRGRERLDAYSERAKAYLLSVLPQSLALHYSDAASPNAANIFHGASTLIVICAPRAPHHPKEDCCLAAQNLMLTAHSLGLGTCPIGFARLWLELPEVKAELSIPANYDVVMPLVVGWPAAIPTSAPPRKDPKILAWFEAPKA